jgi:hypothetical protein
MSNAVDLSKLEKKRAYSREYYRKKKAGILSTIQEEKEEEEIVKEEIVTIQTTAISKEKIKHLLIKPDFTLLLMNHKLHKRLMVELLKKTEFLQWQQKYVVVMNQFKEASIEYNYYHEKCDYYNFIFGILETEITLPFVHWFEKYELVINEFNENQL